MSARTCFGLTGKGSTREEGPMAFGVGDDGYISQRALCRLEPAYSQLLPGHDRNWRAST